MRKIVFFDIDGTLVSKGNYISKSTFNAVQALKKQKILPVIATGRSPLLIGEIAKRLQIDSFISMNGQYIMANGEEIYHNPIPKTLISDFTDLAVKNNDGLMLCGKEDVFSNSIFNVSRNSSRMKALKRISRLVPRKVQMSIVRRSMKKPPKPETYVTKNIYQIILETPIGKEKIYEKAFEELTVTRASNEMLDVINRGVSKATGIQQVLDYYGVSRENSYAFGDHLNDLEMLKYAGTGVAMGNAVPEAKAVSDLTTDHVTKDGIENALRKLELIK